jgi:stage III sporulation protein AH
MKVFNMRKAGNFLLTLISLAVICTVVLTIYSYGREYRAAKVDRTNAMQVVKPVAADMVAPMPSTDFYTECRLERERIRSERSEVLRDAMRGAKNEETRQKAQDAVLKLVTEKQREAEMENLIKARGFADALVVMRDNSVSAIVKAQTLTREEVMQVADVISRVAGVKYEDITISTKP